MADSQHTKVPGRVQDLTGKVMGKWTIIRFLEMRGRHPYWLCRCTCGVEHAVSGYSMLQTSHPSRGCVQCNKPLKTHGQSNTPEHITWKNMIQRCTNRNRPDAKHYAERGIVVCERWRTFTNFLADVGVKPFPRASLDRIDNSQGYICGYGPGFGPGNVRWTTQHQQTRNTRQNRFLTFQGKTLCLTDWATKIGIRRKRLEYHLNKGLSLSEILLENGDHDIHPVISANPSK
jgi:hypothetical protein